MDNNFLDLQTNKITHENAPDLDKLTQSCLILKKKLVETDEVIKQYNDKLKECERLKQELNASKKQMIDYNSSLAKVIKLQMQNTEYKKNIETLSTQLNDHNIKAAADKQHIQQLICKIKDIEGSQNDKIMQYDLEKSSLQVKVKELEEELKNVKKSYDSKMKKIEKKLPLENKSKLKDAKTNIEITKDIIMRKSESVLKDAATNTALTIDVIMQKLKPELKDVGTNTALIKEVIMQISKPELKDAGTNTALIKEVIMQKSELKLKDAGTNTTLTKDVIMEKPKVAEKCVLTDEFYTVKEDIYPIFCNKCEVLLDPPPLAKICKIMTEPCPKLLEKISSPVKKSSSPLQVSTDINSEQCKTEKLPTLDTPSPHLQNHASNHADFIPPSLLPSHTHTLNRTDYCNTFSPTSNLMNQSTYYVGSTPINHLPMTTSNATNQNNHCENIATMASSLSLQKRVNTLEAKLRKLNKKSEQNNNCYRNHQLNAYHAYDMNSSMQFLELCKTMMNFCKSKEKKDTAVHKKSGKLLVESRKPKLSLMKRKRLQSTSSCSWKVESVKKNEKNPLRKRPKKHKRRYCVPLDKSDNFSNSTEDLEKMDCESDVDLSTDTFNDTSNNKTNISLESNSTSDVKPSTSALKTNETGANEVGVTEVVQDLAECNKSGGEIDSGILSDSVESSKLIQLETDMDTCSELMAKKDLKEENSSRQSESSSIENVNSVEAKPMDESTMKVPHLIQSNESTEGNDSSEILSKPDSVESDKLVQLAADLDTSSESIEQNNLIEANSSLQSELSAIEDVKSAEAALVDESTIKVASHLIQSNESTEGNNSSEILSKPDSVESDKLIQRAEDLDTSSESIEQNNLMEANSSLQSESSSIEDVKSAEAELVDESTIKVASHPIKFDESTKRNNSSEMLSTSDSVESDKLVQLATDLDTSSESIEQNNLTEVNSSLQSESSSPENVKSMKSQVIKSPVKVASRVIRSNDLIKKSNNLKILSKPDSVECDKLVQLATDLDTSSESIEQNNLTEVNSSLQSESSSPENVKSMKSQVIKSPVKVASRVIRSNDLIKKSNNLKILSKPDSVECDKLVQLVTDLDTSSESIEQNNLTEVNSSLQSESSSPENVKSMKSQVIKSPVKVASRVIRSNDLIKKSNNLKILSKPDSIESDKLVQLATDLDTSSESIEQNNLTEVNSSLQSESSSPENVKSMKSQVIKSPVKVASRVIRSNDLIKKSNNLKILSKPDSIESDKLVQLATDLDTRSESIEQNNLMEVNSSLQSESSSPENVKSMKSQVIKSPVKVASRVIRSNNLIKKSNNLKILSKLDSAKSNKLVQLEADLNTSSESIEQNNLMEVNSPLQSESNSSENVKSKKCKVVKSPVKVASRVMKSNESIEKNSSLEELSNDDKCVEEVKQTKILGGSPNNLMAQDKRNELRNPGVARKRKINEVQDSKVCSNRQELLKKIKRLKKTSINSNICQNILEPSDVQDQKVEDSNVLPEPKDLVQDIAKEENYIPTKKPRIAHIPKIAIIERQRFTSPLQVKKRLVQKVSNSNAQMTQTNCVSINKSQQNSENNKLQKIYSDLFKEPQPTLSNMPNANTQKSAENTVQEKLIPGAKTVLNTSEDKTSLVTDVNNYGCPDVSGNQRIKVKEAKTESDNYPKYLECERKNDSPDIKEDSKTNCMKEKELLHANDRCSINPVEISDVNEINVNAKEITNSKEESPIVECKLKKYCPFAKLRDYINEKKCSTIVNSNLPQKKLNQIGLITDKFVKIQLQRLMDNEWQASIHWDVIEKLKSTCSVRIIAKGIVEFLSTEEECNVTLDKTYTPPAPLMSVTQQRITALLVDLERVKPTVFEFVQAGIEYKLFRLNQSNQRYIIESLARMYTILARIKKDREKVRIFCCDALYCLGLNATCILYTVLTCWAEVFPNNETNSKLLSKCMAHLIMTLQATEFPKLKALKNLLSILYKYPMGTLSKDILKELLTSLQENCRGEVETAIILLAKREGTTWTYSNVIKGALLPMIINNSLPNTYRAFCLLGNLLRSFPVEDTDNSVRQIIEQLCYLIDSNEGSDEQKEGVISALLSLSRHNFNQVVKNTLKWIPNLLIHDRTIEQIKGLINLRTVEFWWGYLRANKLLDGYTAGD